MSKGGDLSRCCAMTLAREAAKGRLAGEHMLKRYAQGINVGTHVFILCSSCSGLAKYGVPTNRPPSGPSTEAFWATADLTSPKSITFTSTSPSLSRTNMRLDGLMSRCTRWRF